MTKMYESIPWLNLSSHNELSKHEPKLKKDKKARELANYGKPMFIKDGFLATNMFTLLDYFPIFFFICPTDCQKKVKTKDCLPPPTSSPQTHKKD